MGEQLKNRIRSVSLMASPAASRVLSQSKSETGTFVCSKPGSRSTIFDVNLRTQTDYGMRVLLYLAYKPEQTPVETIADAYGISKDHLVKVVQQLVRLGYVRSQSGRFGGVKLARRAEEIRVSQVIADFEGRNGVLPCVGDPGAC